MNSPSSSPAIHYAIEPNLSVEQFVDILKRSTLAERRPVGNLEQLQQMLLNAQLIVTARVSQGDGHANQLVGISRSITDFAYCTYLSDLAVDQAYQGQGIGKQLIRKTHLAAGLHTRLILLAAPAAESYYPHIGMIQHPSCWQVPPMLGEGE